MPQKARLHSHFSGVAGEYFVAAELSRLGYIASLTLNGARGIDVLVSTPDATKSVGVQVKTNQGSERTWLLSSRVEEDVADNLCFVFVNLNGMGVPTYHVVPRPIVAEFCRAKHQAWLSMPSRTGRKRKDGAMRKFDDPHDTYRNRWDLLGLGAPVA